jgi:hypothetical protein
MGQGDLLDDSFPAKKGSMDIRRGITVRMGTQGKGVPRTTTQIVL